MAGSRDGSGGIQEVLQIDIRCHNCGAHRVADYAFILAPLEEEEEE